jgi:uncharacterized protein (TIGR03083 family)
VTEPIADLLETEWTNLIALAEGFDDRDWETKTELPGWTVKDCYSHIVGTELSLQGHPLPEVDLSQFDHLTAPSAVVTEPPVAVRRPVPGADVLAELREVSGERMAELRALPPEKWDEVGPTPVGEAPYREFMEVRTFDCWMHEQDVRRALDRPGNDDGPVAEHALKRCGLALGFVVGKKAAAPDGTSVVFDLSGPLARKIAVAVDGRAKVVPEVPADPTVTLSMSTTAFWCLGGGRWQPESVLADGSVSIEGDVGLGERVVRSMNFMI